MLTLNFLSAFFRKIICSLTALILTLSATSPSFSLDITAQNFNIENFKYDNPGFNPAFIQGITINPKQPFAFTFLLNRGDRELSGQSKQNEYLKLIRYFLASLAIPEKDIWVNLSPYEKNRIIPDNLGLTGMGRDLLEQDYILKQITSSLLHPDLPAGKQFWKELYQAAASQYGTTDIPIDTFNKVWIVPETAEIFQEGNTFILMKTRLKVLLESDYLAARTNSSPQEHEENSAQILSRDNLRRLIIPLLEKEVNQGSNFANLRQITASLILATWYKKIWKNRLLNRIYSDRSKINGIDQDPDNNRQIFEQYEESFQKGVFNLIREDIDAFSREPVARKYFSGGYTTILTTADGSQSSLSERITLQPDASGLLEMGRHDRVQVNLRRPDGQPVLRHSLLAGVRQAVVGLGLLTLSMSASALLPGSAGFLQAETDPPPGMTVTSLPDMDASRGDPTFNTMVASFLKDKSFKAADFPLLAGIPGTAKTERKPFTYINKKLSDHIATLTPAEHFQLAKEYTIFVHQIIMAWAKYQESQSVISAPLLGKIWDCESISNMTLVFLHEAGFSEDDIATIDIIKNESGTLNFSQTPSILSRAFIDADPSNGKSTLDRLLKRGFLSFSPHTGRVYLTNRNSRRPPEMPEPRSGPDLYLNLWASLANSGHVANAVIGRDSNGTIVVEIVDQGRVVFHTKFLAANETDGKTETVSPASFVPDNYWLRNLTNSIKIYQTHLDLITLEKRINSAFINPVEVTKALQLVAQFEFELNAFDPKALRSDINHFPASMLRAHLSRMRQQTLALQQEPGLTTEENELKKNFILTLATYRFYMTAIKTLSEERNYPEAGNYYTRLLAEARLTSTSLERLIQQLQDAPPEKFLIKYNAVPTDGPGMAGLVETMRAQIQALPGLLSSAADTDEAQARSKSKAVGGIDFSMITIQPAGKAMFDTASQDAALPEPNDLALDGLFPVILSVVPVETGTTFEQFIKSSRI